VLTLREVHAGYRLPELRHEVTASTVVLGALASRDWRPMHHDHRFAVERNGVRDIFLNTPNQAGWFGRYVTDWAGPYARIGSMTFRMVASVFPGDTMTLTGTVREVGVDAVGCGWATIVLELATGERTVCTECEVRVAVPVDDGDNPWTRSGADWRP
jgi:acyl dehydratase